MSKNTEEHGAKSFWFVGAAFGRTEDQTARFIREGIWEIRNTTDKEKALVNSMLPGDRIAIKSTYVRKLNLPFDNRGNAVSVMAIKAIGTIKENPLNGQSITVDWSEYEKLREWYFYTYRATVWRVLPANWYSEALIAFAFEGIEQDTNRFRNAPYWRERFGDIAVDDKRRFNWTRFYQSIADKLLEFKGNRTELIAGIHAISSKIDCLTNLKDQFSDGTSGPLKDICPFTAMGIFNRGITDANRKFIAKEFANLLGVSDPVPDSFEGIPTLNNQRSWFFGYARRRQDDDIDALWEVFSRAISFTESDEPEAKSTFIAAYNDASQRYGVNWNLTVGLYWIRPWNFPTLDSNSKNYINKKLNIKSGIDQKDVCNATDYLSLIGTLEARFQEDIYPVHSFPELSHAAYLFKDKGKTKSIDTNTQEDDDGGQIETTVPPIEPYSLENILSDGCFIGREKLKKMRERLLVKKNIILQGPPGTGKTWLAKRLAFALMGQRDDSKIRAFQFHPNLSYEDFIRGWRPSGDGKLALIDGPFMEMINTASKEPTEKFVMVIDEINRGNPAQIFGEMLTLLEADKRTPSEALELSYRHSDDERVFIPDNLYVIGTMNIADRSLALVDLALRRRFAFIDLEPILDGAWSDWVHSSCGIELIILNDIQASLNKLNDLISADPNLGPQYRVGHSYVTPPFAAVITDARLWFRQVVETEIGPLLNEYWFDELEKARQATKHLLEGF